MTMSESQLCCEKCFNMIAKRDANTAKFWMHLCDIQNMTNGILGLKTDDFPQLRKLELARLIITREVPGMILVHVKVKDAHSDSPYYCGGSCGS